MEDALINYFDKPAQFDPERASLATYLRIRARSYLLNTLAKERARSGKEAAAVELEGKRTVNQMGADDPEMQLFVGGADDEIIRELEMILIDPVDLEFVHLMMEGTRETSRFAALLGISDLPAAQQTETVKRHKDRLKKAVQRKYKRKDNRP